MAKELARELINAGVHFGHSVSRWNPKMASFIFAKRGKIHIIDVKKTLAGMLIAKRLLVEVVSSGQDVVFVGTKRQAQKAVETAAQKCGMHYVSQRWLGGMLTNFRTIRSRLQRLEQLEAMQEDGTLESESKKQASRLKREMRKIAGNLEGVRKMSRLPGAVVVVDAKKEYIALAEARKLRIATVGLIDTDSDPETVDVAIPANDDSIRAIDLILNELADAVSIGKTMSGVREEPVQRPRRVRSRRSVLAHAKGEQAEAAAAVKTEPAKTKESASSEPAKAAEPASQDSEAGQRATNARDVKRDTRYEIIGVFKMAEISASMVMELRKMSGQGMMDCKKALSEADGDKVKAMEILRKKGLATLAKRAERETSEGIVVSKTSEDGKMAAMATLCCETDFVARSGDFVAAAETLANYALACSADEGPENILETSIDGKKFSDVLAETISKTGEKAQVGDFAKYKLDGPGLISTYVHFNEKVGAMVQIETSDETTAEADAIKQTAADIAMHITAAKPLTLDKDEVAAETIEKEKAIFAEQVKNKPANIIDKIVEGRMKKFFVENCLVEQRFVKDDSKTVAQVLAEAARQAGGEAKIKRFVRFGVG